MTDEELAARLADDAGKLLLQLRAGGRLSGAALGTAADKAANALILEGLRRWRPDDPVLSEESPDRLDRLSSDRLWIIDPLDGTREYGEGRSDWAVHVALAIDGRPSLGAVALPAKGQVFRSDRGGCASGEVRARPLMVVSRTRPPAETEMIAAMLGAELVPMGSAGAKAMAVVSGDADLYYHSGGQHEWDNCAPAAVAIGAGLSATRLDGTALRYNLPDSMVPDLVIGPKHLADRVVAWCSNNLNLSESS